MLNPTAASSPSPYRMGYPAKTTGRVVISSCSLRKVTIEPAKLTDPTTMVNAMVTIMNSEGRSASMMSLTCNRSSTWTSSTRATIAAAPPPTPLNRATSWGIWVIRTR